MKTKKWILIICAATTCMTSCNDDKLVSSTQLVKSINVTGQDFIDGDGGTRAAYTVDGTGFHFSWTLGDTVGIYPVGGDQVSFPISSGEGSQTAQFDGGAWALRSSYSYAAYYPYVKGNYMVDESSIPVSYIGQTQNGNGSLDCIDRFDYQASVASKPEADGNVNITLKHLGCFVRFQITMPVVDTYKSITLKSSKSPFITNGTIDLTKESISITPSTTADSIKLDLSGTSTTDENKILTIYAMFAPSDLSDSKITISIEGTAYKTYEATITGKNMLAGKAYNYGAKIKSGTNVNGEDVSWEQQDVTVSEYVDLGLSVLWATCNLGASKPEEYGNYYAWGEIETKEVYDWSTYKYNSSHNNNEIKLSKYVNNENYDERDNKTVLDLEDDVVYLKLGSNWRIPTTEEKDELINNCDWTWTTINEVKGYQVISKINGNSIFLPAAGWRRDNDLIYETELGAYWTSAIVPWDPERVLDLGFSEEEVGCRGNWRRDGQSVRPVRSKEVEQEYVDLGLSVMWATCNVGATSEKEIGYRFAWGEVEHDKDHYDWDNYRWGDGSTFTKYYSGVDNKTKLDDEDDAAQQLLGDSWRMPTVDEIKELYENCTWEDVVENGVVVGFRGTARNSQSIYFPCNGQFDESGLQHKYSAKIWTSQCDNYYAYLLDICTTGASTISNHRHDGLCLRAVKKRPEEMQPKYEYVDLGLSVKWATFNVGASSEKEIGYRFAWGEVEHDKDHYDWNNYRWGDGSTFTKYYSGVDNKIKLDDEDDAVQQLWGDSWRMPTVEEAKELYDNCTWDEVVENGVVIGYRATAKNSNSIFFPSNGQLDEYGHENVEMVQIWTSECSGTMAYRLGKGWYGDGVTTYSERHDGLCLRAVQKNAEEIQSNYEYVDLGLSVKWATFNVGATKPEEYGDFFSWGETEAKAKYEWADYKYYSEGDSYSNIKFSKYNTMSRRGVVDNKKTLDLEDDVAHVKWGGNWRMPTKAEQEELKNNCTWTQTSVNGIVGYRVTSKKSGFNDCSIFLPLAGHRADTCLYYSDSNGFYWSSSLNLSDMCSAWYIDFNNGNLNVNSGHYRRNGFSVRPVCP